MVSIHAPARGATSKKPESRVTGLFQSTRPRGARRIYHAFSLTFTMCFNPRARAGRDWSRKARSARRTQFQSTRPRGARHQVAL